MNVPYTKRTEYWCHFIEAWVVSGQGGGYGIIGPKLRRIKKAIMKDDGFWRDVILRHNGLTKTPDQMQVENAQNYIHCQGNFWGMIMQTMVETGLIKAVRG